jgi:O-antigen/teichoic acid export membrane protein
MAIKITNRDIIWNYAGYGINIGINIILLPLILKFLSPEEVGLWYSFLSIGMIATLIDFGFAPTISRNVTFSWGGAKSLSHSGVGDYFKNKEPNFELLNKIINVCKAIYLIIAILALMLMLTAGTVYISYISREIDNHFYMSAWLIYCFAIFLNLFYGYYTSLLRGVGAITEGNKAMVIARSSQIVISVICLMSGLGLIAVSMAYLLSGFILRFFSKRYFFQYENIGSKIKLFPMKINFHDFWATFKAIWHNAWRDGVVALAKFLIMQSNTIMCSIYIGLEATASYALSLQVIMVIASVSSIIFSTYQPLFSQSRMINDYSKLKRVFSVSMVSYYMTYWIGIAGLILVGLPLLDLLNSNTKLHVYPLLFMSIYLFLEYNHLLFASFISTGNKIPYTKGFLVSGLATVITSLLLMRYTDLGVWGLMLSQFTVQILYNNWKWPLVVMNELKVNLKEIIVIGVIQINTLLKGVLRRNTQKKSNN